MPVFIQPSFAKGEVGPALYGRVDTAAYQVALRTARNLIIHPTGGASNRAGTRFIGPQKTHTYAATLIPFEFKTTDSYILEFGDFYMRVIRNDAHVVEDPFTITGITQANPAVVTTSASHGYVDGDEVYIEGVVGMTEVNGKRFKVDVQSATTFELVGQVTGVDVDSTGFTAWSSGGTSERIYEIVTPYAVADLPRLNYVQNADVMTFTHPSYPIHKLSRLDHDNWQLEETVFGPDIDFPRGVAVTVGTAGAVTYRYRVTALKEDTLEESLPGLNTTTRTITAITQANPAVVTSNAHGFANGDEVYIEGVVGMTELNAGRYVVANQATNTFELQGVDSTGFTAYSSGGTANHTFNIITNGAVTANNTISWTAVTGAEKYAVYKEEAGTYGLIGETEATSFLDDGILADTSVSHPRLKDPFNAAGKYPGASGFFEQRQVYGGSLDDPDTSVYSQTGRFDNLNISSPLQDDDAITASLSAQQVNEIRHYVPKNDLLVFTSGGEWRVNSGPDSRLSADTIKQKPQSSWGCSYIRPIVAGSTVLFVEQNNARVRSFGYSFQLDGYTGACISILASHMFKNNTLVSWAYTPSPDPRVIGVRDDGKATCLTFDEEQEVVAWTLWDTKGKFENVAALRNPSGVDGGLPAPYFVARRKINGNTVRYIERMADRRFRDVRDCFFVDCGLTYDIPIAIDSITLGATTTVNATAHGLTDGMEIEISDAEWEPDWDEFDNETQPNQINFRRYFVANSATNSFDIVDSNGNDIDSSAMNAYVEGGYVRRAVLTIGGLEHLEGEQVVVLADGNVVEGLTVADGGITLPRRFCRVHVGLKYIADLETLNVEASQGTIQSRKKKIPSVTVRFEDSRGLFAGYDKRRLTEMKQRDTEAYDEPTRLLTGDKDFPVPSDWNTNGRLFIRQRYPLPMTILAVIPDIQIGG